MITFRVGADDAEFLEKEFEPTFVVQDLVNLGFAHVYLKLMIDGFTSKPFSATTLPPISAQKESNVDAIIKSSREKYAVPKDKAEEQINEWYKPIALERKEGEATRVQTSSPKTSRSLPHAGMGDSDKPQTYPASCAVCNKRIYVPFEPDGKKLLYCKEHMPAPSENRGRSEVRRQAPSFGDGQIMAKTFNKTKEDQPTQTISLKDLENKNKGGSEKNELKKLLEEIKSSQPKKVEEAGSRPVILELKPEPVLEPKTEDIKKGKIKPGQRIKFD
jgi:CxxC-x17-CxxC domain-containing protein